ncbi:MAG: S8 family serine peptidase [Candidatus Omnitrophica bacterium]|nr:S8 family serine peptidase [Candidatus Omnitrophota bacterium]
MPCSIRLCRRPRIKVSGVLSIAGVFCLILFHSFYSPKESFALTPQQRTAPKAAEYAPGEFIVKLKDDKTLNDIQELTVKYGITAAKKVFSNTVPPDQILGQLKERLAALSSAHDKWYWQMDKNSSEYKAYSAKLEKEKAQLKGRIQTQEQLIAHLAERQNRAPQGITPPNLDNIYVLQVPSSVGIPAVVSEFQEHSAVAYAEPNYIMHALIAPNDPFYSSKGSWGQTDNQGAPYDDLWGLKKIEAEKAWDLFAKAGRPGYEYAGIYASGLDTGKPVIVAVVDSGVDYTHEDLAENIWLNPGEFPGVDDNNDGIITLDELKAHGLTDTNADGRIDLQDLWGSKFQDKIDNDGNGYTDDLLGFNFDGNNSNPLDGLGHGTHCAGTIAAVGNNGKGIIGIAPRAKIMALKGLSDEGSGYETQLVEAVRYAADKGADVISNSWGGQGYSLLSEDAFHYAHSKGCVCVAAAGNSNDDAQNYTPANIDTVITVGASNQRDEKCDFSNYGNKIDVMAPGGDSGDSLVPSTGQRYFINILSLRAHNTDMYASGSPTGYTRGEMVLANNYYRARGTSMACPHVAGVAALVLAAGTDLTNDQVKTMIRAAADDLGTAGKDSIFGFGRVNAYWAVLLAGGKINASFSYPKINGFVKGDVRITGKASLYGGFKSYELWYSSESAPAHEVFITSSGKEVIDDGLLGTWHTQDKAEGKYSLILKVFDKSGKVIISSVPATVDNVSEPPVIKGISNNVAVIGRVFQGRLDVEDQDDPDTIWGKLDYSVENLPPTAQFDHDSRIISWQPKEEEKGIYPVKFTVRDNEHTVSSVITLYTALIRQSNISNHAPGYFTLGGENPYVYQDKVVWSDHESGRQIYLYNLSTHEKTSVNTGAGAPNFPAIFEDKIFATDYGEDFFMYNLGTHQKTSIGSAGGMIPIACAIGVNSVLWGNGGNLYLYLWRTGENILITTGLDQERTSISGDKIVYTRSPGWQNHRYISNMYVYDLTKKTEVPVGDRSSVTRPMISRNKIVYEVYDNVDIWNSDIYMYDLTLKKEIPIATGPHQQINNYIFEDKIAWFDGDSNSIFLYDLSKKVRLEILHVSDRIPRVMSFDSAPMPALYGNIVAWGATNAGTSDVYCAQVFYPPVIKGVTPVPPVVNSNITITGEDFGTLQGESVVKIGNSILPIVAWSDVSIICKIPQGAVSGELQIITPGGTAKGGTVRIKSQTIPKPALALDALARSQNVIWLFWVDQSDNEDGFKIERSTNKCSFQQIAVMGENANGYADTNLKAGTTYYYRIRSYNTKGNSTFTNIAQAKTFAVVDTTPPSTPRVLDEGAITARKDRLIIYASSQDKESGIAAYRYTILEGGIQGKPVFPQPWLSFYSTSGSLTIIINSLKLNAGKKYYCLVESQNGAGLWSKTGYSDGILVK